MDNGEGGTEDEDSENFIKPAITDGSFIETGLGDFQVEESLDSDPSGKTADKNKQVKQKALKEPHHPAKAAPFRKRSGSRPYAFSPEKDPLSFITQLDDLVKAEENLMIAKKEAQQCAKGIFKSNGVVPLFREKDHKGSEYYRQVIEAYREIRRLILEPGAQDSPDLKWHIASLEVIGALLLNPGLLANIKYYDGNEQTSPYLLTFSFTTNQARSLVEKIVWDDGVSFVWTKKTLHHLNHKPP